jgi:hypothetical protein
MPAPVDLTGKVFGKLVVARYAGTHRYAGTPKARFWWCACRCGREESVYQKFLANGRITSCQICRRGPCVVCGGEITRQTKSNTCSDACRTEHKRDYWRQHYHVLVDRNPEYNQQRVMVLKDRLAHDPDLAAVVRERDRAAKRRYIMDHPELAEKRSVYQQEHYEKNREAILERRRQRLALLPDEQIQELKERAREQGRTWRRAWREQIAQDPELYADYLRYQRAARRKHYAQKALADVMKTTQTLKDMIDEPDKR